MAYGMGNIAGMLARSGMQLGQSIGDPIDKLGADIGSGITQGMLTRDKEKAVQEAQDIIKKYSNDPTTLNTYYQQAALRGETELAKVFKEAAEAARAANKAKKTAQMQSLEEAGAESTLKAQTARAIQMAGQAKDTAGLVQLRSGAISPVDYINEQADRQRQSQQGMALSERYKTVGNRIFDVQEQRYLEPSAAAETLTISQLKDVATPESILEYVQTGDKNALQPIAVEEEAPASQLASQIAQADNVLTTVKESFGLSEEIFPVFYDVAKYAPNTDARALSGKIDTLKANLSFDRLQKMRDESKTGGALGQVSNIELNLLGSNVAALDPASKDFAKQLEKVEESYRSFKASLLGKKPPSDKYVEDNGVLYYEDDDGNLYSLGEL